MVISTRKIALTCLFAGNKLSLASEIPGQKPKPAQASTVACLIRVDETMAWFWLEAKTRITLPKDARLKIAAKNGHSRSGEQMPFGTHLASARSVVTGDWMGDGHAWLAEVEYCINSMWKCDSSPNVAATRKVE
jgi:hypothetical protein